MNCAYALAQPLGRTCLRLLQGDITAQAVEAIVNAANASLLGGGGVDGAIHRRGGPAILAECQELRRRRYPDGLPVGEAVATTAGQLPARRVIHTVGPVWRGGTHGEEELLARAHRRSLEVAREEGLRSVAFPAISTGAYGFPKDRAAPIALRAVAEAVAAWPDAFDEIRFVLFTPADWRVYARAALELTDEGS